MTNRKTSTKQRRPNKNELTLELITSPEIKNPIFLSGNFNNWYAGDPQYKLEKVQAGKYRFTFKNIDSLPDEIEYKYLQENWGNVELDGYGNGVHNRKVLKTAKYVLDEVPLWMNQGQIYNSAFLPKIQLISEEFEIPQLIRTRRIAALLPHDYYESDRSYPVLYLQDGQNLFDDFAPFGNWAIDKKLAIMAERGLGNIIIIAIDHAEEERISEFTPSYRTKLGRGDGKKYVRFLADTLKPYVDSHFRTIPDRDHTGIGGSSMGALISIYAGFMYPEVYKSLMLFSPSLWVAPHIHFNAIQMIDTWDMNIYLYAGAEESQNMIPNIQRFKQAFEDQNQDASIQFELSIDPNGKHNEARWGAEFPKAIEWLFFSK